jgi:sucrose phosphorylase
LPQNKGPFLSDSNFENSNSPFADLRGTSGATNVSRQPQSAVEYALVEYLTHLYGGGVAPDLSRTLLQIVANRYESASRAAASSEAPTSQPPLCERDILLITYADTIVDKHNPPLQVLKAFADRHLADYFSGIHILPFYPFSSDDGFAVVDYNSVRADLGSWNDVRALGANFDLMFDLVINHCSREHLWFADFLTGRAPGCDFFIELPAETVVDSVVRPRNTPLLSEIQTYAGPKHVWTTFSDDQIDLNFENPQVLCQFVEILFDYINQGARFIRLDAIAFLWKRLGTSCMSLPETHMVVKIMRLLIDHSGAPVQLLTETNVPHAENVSYFGQQDEAHMVYQFSLAPLLLYSYLFNDGRYLQSWATALEQPPEGCAYLNFIASHDGIGLRPLEGLVPADDVNKLINTIHERGGFVTMRTAADGNPKAYEMNISLFSAFGGTATAVPAYVAAHQLLLAFQGVPALYLRALLASLNDLTAVERTGRTRTINRGQQQITDINEHLSDSASVSHNVFKAITAALQTRRLQPAFNPGASQHVLPCSADLFALSRHAPEQTILVLASFSKVIQTVSLPDFVDLESYNSRQALELLSGTAHQLDQDLKLAPYQVVWLQLERS